MKCHNSDLLKCYFQTKFCETLMPHKATKVILVLPHVKNIKAPTLNCSKVMALVNFWGDKQTDKSKTICPQISDYEDIKMTANDYGIVHI